MEELLRRLKEYLAMDHELPFEEFQQYYMELMKVLTEEFESMSNEKRVMGRCICQIVSSNAQGRAGQSRAHGKKFKKISEKCTFWVEAIDYRLGKEGLSKTIIDSMSETVEKSMEAVDKSVENVDKSADALETPLEIGEKTAEAVDISIESVENPRKTP